MVVFDTRVQNKKTKTVLPALVGNSSPSVSTMKSAVKCSKLNPYKI